MEYLASFVTIAVIHVLSCASPGPDFFMVMRSSLVNSRQSGLLVALGLGCGCLVHFTYCLFGLGVLISESVFLYSCIKLLGAGYLAFLGIKSFRAGIKPTKTVRRVEQKPVTGARQAVGMGFFTNVLNPKCAFYFLSLFTQVINVDTPSWVYAVYGLEVFVLTVLWFGVLALLLSMDGIRAQVQKIQRWVELVLGVLLVGLGIKIAVGN